MVHTLVATACISAACAAVGAILAAPAAASPGDIPIHFSGATPERTGPNIPGPNIPGPNIDVPDVNVPNRQRPKRQRPNVNVPTSTQLNAPNIPGNVNVPNVNVPNVNLDVPEVADIVPDFNVPEVADIVPDFNVAEDRRPQRQHPSRWRWWRRRRWRRPSVAGRGRSATGSARYGHGGFAQWVNCNAESRD